MPQIGVLLTNNFQYCLISTNVVYQRNKVLFNDAIAHDKGKPAARLGRKAVSLAETYARGFETVWLPKAIEEQPLQISTKFQGELSL